MKRVQKESLEQYQSIAPQHDKAVKQERLSRLAIKAIIFPSNIFSFQNCKSIVMLYKFGDSHLVMDKIAKAI